MVAVHEADGFGFGAAFEHLIATAQFQILDQDDAIAVGEHIAVGVLDHAGFGGIGFARALPFVAAGDTFPFIGKFQNFGHLAHRAGRFAHEPTGQPQIAVEEKKQFCPLVSRLLLAGLFVREELEC